MSSALPGLGSGILPLEVTLPVMVALEGLVMLVRLMHDALEVSVERNTADLRELWALVFATAIIIIVSAFLVFATAIIIASILAVLAFVLWGRFSGFWFCDSFLGAKTFSEACIICNDILLSQGERLGVELGGLSAGEKSCKDEH